MSAAMSPREAGELLAPALLTLEQAAERLHKKPRWLKDFLRVNPYGRKAGRTWLFTEADLFAIITALPCPSKSSDDTEALTGTFAGRSAASLLTRAQNLLNEDKRKPSGRNAKPRSSSGKLTAQKRVQRF